MPRRRPRRPRQRRARGASRCARAGARAPDNFMKFAATVGSQTHVVDVIQENGRYRVTLGDAVWEVDARLTAHGIYSLLIDGVSHVADVDDHAGECMVEVAGE